RSAISRQSFMSINWRPLPARIRMPSCSPPSRTSPSGGHTWPSLTAAPRAGRALLRAGTKEWLRPNKRMERKRRTKWHHTTYREPKASTVHQTGATSRDPLDCFVASAPRNDDENSHRLLARHAEENLVAVEIDHVEIAHAVSIVLRRLDHLGVAPDQ